MNSEPPTGDDLQRMLVDMKQTVLARADDVRPRPVRRRHVWPVVGIVALLAVGTASGAYAAGLVPHTVFGSPASKPAPTPTPTTIVTAPATTPPPVAPSPTPTPSKVYSLDDPGTWTISYTEVGPVALGAPNSGEVDDLTTAYTNGTAGCPNPDVSIWNRAGSVPLVVVQKNGVVSGVAIGMLGVTDPSHLKTDPTTAEGAGIGSTLDQLKTLYPAITKTGSAGAGGATPSFDIWSIQSGGHYITFELDVDNVHVGQVWVSSDSQPPSEFCG